MTAAPFDFEVLQRIATLNDYPRLSGEPVLESATLKSEPEDFEVEEIPAYEPCGSGEHLFVWIEKRDLTTEQLKSAIARMLEISTRDVGTAGNKDKRAVTRQWVSVPATQADRVQQIDHPAFRVIRAARHQNKLRTGHLKGNRFNILLRTTTAPDIAEFDQKFKQLRDCGFLNYYGPQRFGRGDTLQLGHDILTGRQSRRSVTRALGRSMFRLGLSAVQSAVFNQLAVARSLAETICRVQPGDVLMFRDRRTHFRTEDPAADQPRVDSGELVITGPIPGPKMTSPTELAAKEELRVMEELGLVDEMFSRYPKMTIGTRRRLVEWPEDLSWEWRPEGLRLQFTLASGTYATVLLRELVAELVSA